MGLGAAVAAALFGVSGLVKLALLDLSRIVAANARVIGRSQLLVLVAGGRVVAVAMVMVVRVVTGGGVCVRRVLGAGRGRGVLLGRRAACAVGLVRRVLGVLVVFEVVDRVVVVAVVLARLVMRRRGGGGGVMSTTTTGMVVGVVRARRVLGGRMVVIRRRFGLATGGAARVLVAELFDQLVLLDGDRA